MILIGLIFASGFRKKAGYFSPPPLVGFSNLCSANPDFEERWVLGRGAALGAGARRGWVLVGEKGATLRGRGTCWWLQGAVSHLRGETLKCQVFPLASVVLAVVFLSGLLALPFRAKGG